MISIVKEIEFTNRKVALIKLQNNNNLELTISNYGASILSLLIPTTKESKVDVTLGYNSIEELLEDHYQRESNYFGCTIGRYANRISEGKFKIGGSEYQLIQNEGQNHLHGGFYGLNKVIWDYKINKNSVVFSHISNDGFEGYPGNLKIELEFSLTDKNEVDIKYKATTDQPTPINLTNHVYFNLNGAKSNVLNHAVQINSKKILQTDNQNIPTGELTFIRYSDFDFSSKRILNSTYQMNTVGYDNSYILNNESSTLNFAANISEPGTPYNIDVFTNQPCIQLYTANHFNGSFIGKKKKPYRKHFGVCIETQAFPDSPNHDNFPNTILYPGKEYFHHTIYKINLQE